MNRKKATILVLDPDSQSRRFLKGFLNQNNFKLRESVTAVQAMRQAMSVGPDLIIADTHLPGSEPTEFISDLRQWSQIPLIICSEAQGDNEVIELLNAGADDHIGKPFNPDVLLARVRASLRRAIVADAGKPALTNGHISMDLIRHEVSINGETCFLTPKEYDLLRYFMTNRGKMITHRQLLKALWGPMHVEHMQYLRVYVSQLREKIEPTPCNPAYIVTEPGVGYRMEIVN